MQGRSKVFIFIILLFIITSPSCHVRTNMTSYYVKISPLGISDVPRDILIIGQRPIDSITANKFAKQKPFKYYVETDKKTFERTISFLDENDPHKAPVKSILTEYGSFNISVFDSSSLITSYSLGRLESKKFFNSLIEFLIKSNLDTSMVKKLKENALGPINY